MSRERVTHLLFMANRIVFCSQIVRGSFSAISIPECVRKTTERLEFPFKWKESSSCHLIAVMATQRERERVYGERDGSFRKENLTGIVKELEFSPSWCKENKKRKVSGKEERKREDLLLMSISNVQRFLYFLLSFMKILFIPPSPFLSSLSPFRFLFSMSRFCTLKNRSCE